MTAGTDTAPRIALRPATLADIDAMWALRTRCVREVCRSHYPPAVIEAWASAPAPATFPQLIASGGAVLAEDAGGRPLGFGMVDLAGGEIDGLFVAPDVRGGGLGRRLLQALEAKLAPGTRIHLAAALNAVAFYRAQGYAVLREGRYAHPSGLALACVYLQKHRGQAPAAMPQAAGWRRLRRPPDVARGLPGSWRRGLRAAQAPIAPQHATCRAARVARRMRGARRQPRACDCHRRPRPVIVAVSHPA